MSKVVRTVHFCPATGEFMKREYKDTYSSSAPNAPVIPVKDNNNNPLDMEVGLSTFRDTQTMYIQEMPERAPAGQLPRSVECLLEDDLVDTVKPGDRVRMYGVYRPVTTNLQNGANIKTVIVVNHIQPLTRQIQNPDISPKDTEYMKQLSQRPNVVDILAKSMAPSIYGHDNVKKALLLALLSGLELNLNNGMHIRGDINILLVGDPSTAKSQLLRFMMHISPLAVSTTGRASTGVGLTAAVVMDAESGERTLQAGAMVLADRGVVCVDEFDKMNDLDRIAMHEVMEQQTVTIAKAGVHTQLNARCTVVAAANPIYGQYNRNQSVQRNIGLPDSLLSRFDLVFIILDERDAKRDREVSDHVLNIHRYKSPFDERVSGGEAQDNSAYMPLGVDWMKKSDEQAQSHEEEDAQKLQAFLQGNEESKEALVSITFLRKYIFNAKLNVFPAMSDAICEYISEKYAELRKNNVQKTLPITPRSLETIIRLSTAHAKCRMADEVTMDDVNAVFELMTFAICFMNNTNQASALQQAQAAASSQQQQQQQEPASPASKNKKRKRADEEEKENDDSNINGQTEERPAKKAKIDTRTLEDDIAEDEMPNAPAPSVNTIANAARKELVKDFLFTAQEFKRGDSLTIAKITKSLNEATKRNNLADYTEQEVSILVDSIAKETSLFVFSEEDGEVFGI